MNVLIVAAHPDDEVLGCGGTLAYLARQKASIYGCFLSEKVGARHKKPDHATFLKQIARAHRVLGIKKTMFFDFPNIQMNTVPTLKLVQSIEKAIQKFRPEIIFTHHWGDVNEDHSRVFEATVAAARLPDRGNIPGMPRTMIKKILCYEVPSSTDWGAPLYAKAFVPNVYYNIEKTIKLKLKALKEYREVVRTFPHPCSIEGLETLAKYRGLQSGLQRAEAFQSLKDIHL